MSNQYKYLKEMDSDIGVNKVATLWQVKLTCATKDKFNKKKLTTNTNYGAVMLNKTSFPIRCGDWNHGKSS